MARATWSPWTEIRDGKGLPGHHRMRSGMARATWSPWTEIRDGKGLPGHDGLISRSTELLVHKDQ